MTDAAARRFEDRSPGLSRSVRAAVESFRDFYQALVDVRAWIVTWGRDPALVDDHVRVLRARLLEAVSRHGGEARAERLSDQIAVRVNIAYVMIAMADEMLITQFRQWPGHGAWSSAPLEFTTYGIRLSGDWLFETADDLATGREFNPPLAAVILLALKLGFRGRYADGDDGGEIERCGQGLLRCLFGDRPSDRPPPADDTLQSRRLGGGSVRRLPALWPWLALAPAILLAYLVVSLGLWSAEVRGVRAVAHSVNALDAPLDPSSATPAR